MVPTRVSRRWLVPVAAVGLIAAGAGLGPVVADASPELPDVTPQQLLTRAQTAKVDGLSGTVRMTAELGLPALPGVGGQGHGRDQGQAGIQDLLAGKHTVRVAFAAPDKARVAVLDDMAERTWTTDGKTAWLYSSDSRQATRLTLPQGRSHEPRKTPAVDPQAVAKQFLDAVQPSTAVSVTGTESVAGRDAYLLHLVPRTDRTTVGSVTIAVDAREWVPLRVTVMPKAGEEPALQVGFTDVSFAVPAASTFAFTPPQGTKVTDRTVPTSKPQEGAAKEPRKHPKAGDPASRAAGAPTIVGTGWETVAVSRWKTGEHAALDQLLRNARTVQGSWGSGKVLTSRMVTALFTDDGRVLVGMVPSGVLEQAAAKAPR